MSDDTTLTVEAGGRTITTTVDRFADVVDRVVLAFAGQLELDGTDDEDLALFRAMKLGKGVVVRLEIRSGGEILHQVEAAAFVTARNHQLRQATNERPEEVIATAKVAVDREIKG